MMIKNHNLAYNLFKNFFSFEHGYFKLSGNSIKYFFSQGNIPAHIVDRIKFRIFPKLKIIPEFPTHLDIETSSLCQMRCPMCYTTYLDNSLKGIMQYDLFKRIIRQAVAGKVYSVKLSWRGEPLLNPHIVDMVRFAKENGIKEVAFLTNGERLSKERTQSLVDAGLDWISFSVDGVGDTYESIRFPAKFYETIEKIKYMRQYREEKGKKKPLIRIQCILSAIKNNAEEFKKTWEGIADRVNFITDEIRDFKNHNLMHDPYYVCPSPWQRMSIAYDGKVHQCITDYAAKWVLGDARVQPLKEIWHGNNFNILRRHFKEHKALDNCKACYYCTDNVLTERRILYLGGKKIIASKYKGVDDIVSDSNTKVAPEGRNT